MGIKLTNISKSFTNDGENLPVLRQVTLNIADGEAVAILGPSGCGKTTLLRVLAGLEQYDSGNLEIGSRTGKQAALEMIFQQPALLPWRTALENVLLPVQLSHELSSSVQIAFRADALELLTRTGLRDFVTYFPHQLSGGMKSRVAIARGLVTKPDILLLDEPFSSLDEVTRGTLQEMLLRIAAERNLTVVFVTHSVDEAVVVSDRVIVLSSRPAAIMADVSVTLAHDVRERRDSTAASQLRVKLREMLTANASGEGQA